VTLLDHEPGCAVEDGVGFCTCGAISRLAAEVLEDAPYIHPKAHVAETVVLGPRTKVWQFASLAGATVLGADCSVWPLVMLDGPKFGDRCKIASGVAMGPGFEIGSDVFIGPNATFANDAFPRADRTGWEVDLLRDGSLVTIRVGDGASIGANAVVLPGIRIGARAMIAAGAVCGRDVPADHLFKRSGEIVEINTAWAARRMRAA
jgi:acetyltransferase-like isoleucine patch superfamily enzyme